MQFFHISTSKSGLELRCFAHFDFQMCFAPQWRALFRHLNFQKGSGAEVFVLTCTCASRQNGVHFFDTLTSKTALLLLFASKFTSRHNGVHFLYISTSKSGPNMVCFGAFHVKMCFAPQRHAIFHLSSGQLAPHPAALASLLFDPPEPQNI